MRRHTSDLGFFVLSAEQRRRPPPSQVVVVCACLSSELQGKTTKQHVKWPLGKYGSMCNSHSLHLECFFVSINSPGFIIQSRNRSHWNSIRIYGQCHLSSRLRARGGISRTLHLFAINFIWCGIGKIDLLAKEGNSAGVRPSITGTRITGCIVVHRHQVQATFPPTSFSLMVSRNVTNTDRQVQFVSL